MFRAVLFPDATRDAASWMYICYPVGGLDSESHLRDFLKRFRRRISRAATRFGCHARSDVIITAASQRSGASAAATSSSHIGRRQSTRGSSRTPTFSQGDDNDDDEAEQDDDEKEHEDKEASTHDEIGMLQIPDAPSTQASQRLRRSARPSSTYTPGTDALAKGKGRAKRQ